MKFYRNKKILSGFFSRQFFKGSVLIESLLALMIFSIGAVGLLALQLQSIKSADDARYRSEATRYAQEILSKMAVDSTNRDDYVDGGAAPSRTQIENLIEGTGGNPGALPKGVLSISQVGATDQFLVRISWTPPGSEAPAGADGAHNIVVVGLVMN